MQVPTAKWRDDEAARLELETTQLRTAQHAVEHRKKAVAEDAQRTARMVADEKRRLADKLATATR